MSLKINVNPQSQPILDPEFIPAVLWNREYRKAVSDSGQGEKIIVALERPNGNISTFTTETLPLTDQSRQLTIKYVERLVKCLLWIKGGCKVTIAGSRETAAAIKNIYAPGGQREFDGNIFKKIYGRPLEIAGCEIAAAPQSRENDVPLGGHLDGCRIGFDLGGSDRKCAAVIDGKTVFSEEIKWDPYFQKDPSYHLKGIEDSLKRAAEKLPRVDAIGGSAAGVYVDNRVRVASLFRGVSETDFDRYVTDIFLNLRKKWNNIPFVVVNDGEVTALAGAMEMQAAGVLGISMGTSQAAGYVNPEGNITDWLNELAFVPVDYRDAAPVDEWSGDGGCGVQYFSQQAVARLATPAGIVFEDSVPLPERLSAVQELMVAGDERARNIYETIGTYFAYAIAHYTDFYDIRNLLILGRVTSGEGGNLILGRAEQILKAEFPELAQKISFRTPDEKNKRHGQAVAAASLPILRDNK